MYPRDSQSCALRSDESHTSPLSMTPSPQEGAAQSDRHAFAAVSEALRNSAKMQAYVSSMHAEMDHANAPEGSAKKKTKKKSGKKKKKAAKKTASKKKASKKTS